MEDWRFEFHFRWEQGILHWKLQVSSEKSACTIFHISLLDNSLISSPHHDTLSLIFIDGKGVRLPAALTTVIFAVVANHEHNFPFEDVIRNEAYRYPRDGVFGSLHGFELTRKEAGGGGRGHSFFLFSFVACCCCSAVICVWGVDFLCVEGVLRSTWKDGEWEMERCMCREVLPCVVVRKEAWGTD